jgi:peptide deformylase
MRAIRIFPDPILRRKATPVIRFGQPLQRIVEMLEHVRCSQSHGIGIAAPQIGLAMKIAIVDVSARIPGAEKLILINPEILARSIERTSREGCMSIPDYTAIIKRYDFVRFRYQNLAGKWVMRESRGIEAICVQHELDHLDGQLFIDRVTSLKRDMIPRKRY